MLTFITLIYDPVFIKLTQYDAVSHKYPASNSYISTHLHRAAAASY